MTNQKLGILLVDVPEPRLFEYYPLVLDRHYNGGTFFLDGYDEKNFMKAVAYKCTKEEAVKHPQFKWVALEELYD
ncbi:hypothetical protein [Streptococcus suis]|uniref:hypothetical protein n=1 Tax=Streptococcus suis TaxID=1307 RepID=UPI000CF60F2E|nr:hypothetical protein [Streptococcus suis]